MSFLLLSILVLAGAVRFYALGNQSLWSDEGNSMALATRTFAEIARDSAHDIHPPLYYWLLKIWVGAFGSSEVALRSLSASLGVLLVLAVAELGRRLYGESTGLAAAFVAALAPFQVYYSQEARMYILLALLSTLSVLAFWHIVQSEQRAFRGQADAISPRLPLISPLGIAMSAIWAAGFYTHYAFPLMVGVVSLLYLAWLWYTWGEGQVGRRLLRWAMVLAVALLLYAPWLPTAAHQLLTWPAGAEPQTVQHAIPLTLTLLGLGPTERDHVGQWWIWILPALALLGVVPWRWLSARRSARPSGAPQLCLPWLSWGIPLVWVFAPLAMMLALGLFRDAYLKFLLVASPAFSLLLARSTVEPALTLSFAAHRPAVGRANRPVGFMLSDMLAGIWVTGLLALIGALSGTALVRYYSDPTVFRDDYRSIAQFITATSQPNDVILLDAPGQSEVFSYYYHGDLPVYALPRQRPIDANDTANELSKLLQHDKVYALYWAAEEADPGGMIESWMNNRGYNTLDQWRGNVRLAVYVMPERRAPDETAENLNTRLGPAITLLGYRGWNLSPAAGEVTQLQLLWRTDEPLTNRYKVFIQLLDARDQVIAQRDTEPAGDSLPTDTWQPGEVITDNHGLLIQPGTPPGTYRRIIGMYDRETNERLRLPNGKDFISLPPITVTRSRAPLALSALDMQHAQRFDFGGITLLGHNRYKRGFGHAPDTPLYPGDRLHLTFFWQANIQPRADWWFNLALNDSDGHTVASLQAPLVGDTYCTTLWEEGEVVRGEHDLNIPVDLPPDTYRLSLTMLPDTDTPAGVAAYLGTVNVSRP